MTDAATDQGNGNIVDDDCPLCLEPLPPFWDVDRRIKFHCCGGAVCKGCRDKRDEHLDRAIAEGTFGRQEEQLNNYCALCRTPRIKRDDEGRLLLKKYERGLLPLQMYLNLVGKFVKGEGVERDVQRGNEILRLGAERGDPMCQHMLGIHYEKGCGLPQSTTEAKRWWLAAAEQGHAIAEFMLADMFRNEGNVSEYLRYLRSSAAKGYDDACCSLGLHYYFGEHGGSAEEAIQLVTLAAEIGHAPSMSILGTVMCRPDPHLPPPMPRDNLNFTQGMQWIRQAVEKGSQSSIVSLKSMEKWASSTCFQCSKEAPEEKAFLRCSRCRAAWYCSKDCQVQHWKVAEGGHKQCCIKWCPPK